MHLEVRARNGQISPTFEEWVERRLSFALARFGGRIRRITAFLEDINGPRGGADQYCRIDVSMVPSGTIMAEATEEEAALAVSRAAERVARRVRDALDRRRTMRTRKSTPRQPGEVR